MLALDESTEDLVEHASVDRAGVDGVLNRGELLGDLRTRLSLLLVEHEPEAIEDGSDAMLVDELLLLHIGDT